MGAPLRIPGKRYHFAAAVRSDGAVIALCAQRAQRPRPINLRVASWTLRGEAVTCPRCRQLLRQMLSPGEPE